MREGFSVSVCRERQPWSGAKSSSVDGRFHFLQPAGVMMCYLLPQTRLELSSVFCYAEQELLDLDSVAMVTL